MSNQENKNKEVIEEAVELLASIFVELIDRKNLSSSKKKLEVNKEKKYEH